MCLHNHIIIVVGGLYSASIPLSNPPNPDTAKQIYPSTYKERQSNPASPPFQPNGKRSCKKGRSDYAPDRAGGSCQRVQEGNAVLGH